MISYHYYTIKQAHPTGGKAGKHRNLTSTVQVYGPADPTLMLKQFRYDVGSTASLDKAIAKAKSYIDLRIREAQ